MHPYLPFAVLPLVVTAAWFAASHQPDRESHRYHVPSVSQIEDPSVPAGAAAESAEKPVIRVAAFLPKVPPRPPVPVPTLILHSVMTGTDVHLATINGRVLKEGDAIEGYLVERIEADGVTLARAGQTRHLPMRSIHELPPPVQPGTAPPRGNATAQTSNAELTRHFWETFDSSQTQL